MVCPKCGARIEDGSLFCDECGGKLIRRSPLNEKKEKSAQPAKKRGKKRNTTRILFLVGTMFVIAAMVIGIVVILKNRKANDASEYAGTTDYVDTEATWQEIYTSYLALLVPDRMSTEGWIKMTLIDLNFDGTPELLDYRQVEDVLGEKYVDIHYIDSGCPRLLGSLPVSSSGDVSLYICKDNQTGNRFFLDVFERRYADFSEDEYRLLGGEGSEAPYLESLFLMQSSANEAVLLNYVPQSAIQYEQDTAYYYAYSCEREYVSQDTFSSALIAFKGGVEMTWWELNCFCDGQANNVEAQQASYYSRMLQEGSSEEEAAVEIAKQVFNTYTPVD